MKVFWQVRQSNRDAIIFCNGWGMDPTPFGRLGAAHSDVVVLYDYYSMNLPDDWWPALAKYERLHLVGWSMGVWAAQKLFRDQKNLFSRRIAVNGTPCPIHDRFGIPVETFKKTLATFSDEGCQRFYKRMCRPGQLFDQFMKVSPKRSIASQKQELVSLEKMVGEDIPDEDFFTGVVISDKDMVMPTANQHSYWKDKNQVTGVKGCHFPFFLWKEWEDVLVLHESHE